jgi:hypothetical protein
MTSEEALRYFLSRALQERWRDRYTSLIQTKRGQKRLLADLWHEFESRLDPAKVVNNLPAEVWAAPAYIFRQNMPFGQEEISVQSAFDSVEDGCLIIDSNGRYGVHKPEDMVDDIKYFSV